MKVLQIIGASVVGLIVLAGLIFGGWEAGWWFRTQNVNRTAHLFQNSYGTQSAYIEQLQNQITQIDAIDVQVADTNTPASEVTALQAQKKAIINQACGIAANITVTMPSDEAQFAATHCP